MPQQSPETPEMQPTHKAILGWAGLPQKQLVAGAEAGLETIVLAPVDAEQTRSTWRWRRPQEMGREQFYVPMTWYQLELVPTFSHTLSIRGSYVRPARRDCMSACVVTGTALKFVNQARSC